MANNLQRKLDFNGNDVPHVHVPPEGYKGLSGFHKYWGKKPTEAWRLLIENLTDKNDIVLDPFLGSGLIAKECIDQDRRFIGFDVNPISIELTRLYLQLPDYLELKDAIAKIERSIKSIINEMYLLSDNNIVTHFLWDKDSITKVWTKSGRRRVELDLKEDEIANFQNISSYKPKYIRNIRLFDNSRINSKQSFSITDLFTPRALRAIDLLKEEIQTFSGATKRALLLILSSSLGQMSKMVFAVSKRGKTKGREIDKIEVGSWVIGYWRPKQHFEINAWNCFENKARKLLKAVREAGEQDKTYITNDLMSLLSSRGNAYLSVGDSEFLLKDIPSNSIKVVLTDPPHGDRIPYLELSEMWNSVIGLTSNYAEELVVSNAKERKKDLNAYNKKLTSIFAECARVLSDNGLLAVMFNARSENHWDSLHELEQSSDLEYVGCYPMEYSAGSVVQDNRKGGLKTDFVLLYGKNISKGQKSNIASTFNIINEWSTEYPKKAS